jgi:hypothetical protein
MNYEIVHEQTQALRKELADIQSANSVHFARTRRSPMQEFKHQERQERLQTIVEEISRLGVRRTGNCGLAKNTFNVRFKVLHEPDGPVLSCGLAGPQVSAVFSSQRYDSTASLINALSEMRLPGWEIAAGKNPDRVFVVGAAQLDILKLRIPE